MDIKSHPRSSFFQHGRPASLVLCVLLAWTGTHAYADSNVLRPGVGKNHVPRYSGSDQSVDMTAFMFDDQEQNGFFSNSMHSLGDGRASGDVRYSLALAYCRGLSDRVRFSGDGGCNFLRCTGGRNEAETILPGFVYAPVKLPNLNAVSQLPLAAVTSASDPEYMQICYGVTEQRLVISGFVVYNSTAGLYAINTALIGQHDADMTWSLISAMGSDRLTIYTARSPFVTRKTASNAGISKSATPDEFASS